MSQDLGQAHEAIARARPLVAQKNHRLAFEQLLVAKAAAGSDPDTLKNVANLLIDLAEYGTAIEVLGNVLLRAPRDFPARIQVLDARSRQRIDPSEQANLAATLNVMLAEPDFPATLLIRASDIFRGLRDMQSAIAVGTKALEAPLDRAAAVLHLLRMHLLNRQWQQHSLKSMRRAAVDIPARQTKALVERGIALPEARPETLADLAKAAYALGFPVQAVCFAQRAYTLRTNAVSSIRYSHLLSLTGQHEAALAVLVPQLSKVGEGISTENVLIAAEVLLACERPDLEATLINRIAQERPSDMRIQQVIAASLWMQRMKNR